MSYIELHDIIKVYNKERSNEVTALRGVNLTIEKGESVAIMGVSGSGKSTLLHILGLVDNYDSGQYILDGMDVATLSDAKRAVMRNTNIGFALQDFGLLENESVEENIRLPLYFSGVKHREFNSRVYDAADTVCISDLLKRKVKQLSGGQLQRVALARAIVMNPDIILADEPTSALDRMTSDEIMSSLLMLNKIGKTIIMVTHDKHVAEKMSRILYIQDGVLVDKLLD